jgi:hypothetical protein
LLSSADGDPGAFSGHGLGDGLSKATASACHQSDFVRQIDIQSNHEDLLSETALWHSEGLCQKFW